MLINCSAEPCPVLLDASCVFYTGTDLLYTGIVTNDNLQTALEKIDAKFQASSIGYVFQNGIYQDFPSTIVKLGGQLIENTTLISNGYDFTVTGNILADKHITIGGSSSQFLKGDGSLDNTSYQPAGSYITGIAGDGNASGPGLAIFTLNNVNSSPGTWGNSTNVPIITVNSKGLITGITSTLISVPSSILSFIGDVTGSGSTGSATTLTLNTVNSNVYNSDTFLKFSVNGKGLITSATPITNLDIEGVLGYTPVPSTRILTINGVSYDLSADRTWTISTGTGTVTSVGVVAGVGISTSVTDPTTTPVINITNTAPDQIVTLTPGAGISILGTYPNFTISNTSVSNITGSGTTNYVSKWSGASSLTNSQIFDDGTNVGINRATPNFTLDVNGEVLANGGIRIASGTGVGNKNGIYPGGNMLQFWAGNSEIARMQLGGGAAGFTNYLFTQGLSRSTGGSDSVASFRIAASVQSSLVANTVNFTQLLIDPQYIQSTFGSGILRGIYYNPTLTSLNGSPHRAWENTSGDIIFGNLTGVGTRMVVVSSTGQISTQAIPGGGSGTVTSVSAGTGMNFSTITTTGSIDIDTNKVPYYSGGFSTGFAKWNGATWVFDNSIYLTTISGLNISLLTNDSGYITSSALSSYLTSATAASTYFPLLGGSITGTAGAGFFGAIAQSSNPSTPTSGFRLFANSTHALSWIGQNGYIRTFDGTANTADRTYTLPNISGTLPLGTGTANELTYWSGTNTISTLTTATYPSLTELSYVKGVTSSIQPQIDAAKENHLIKAYNAMGSPIKAQSLGLGMHNIGSAATIGATNNSRLTLIAIYLETPQTITGVKWYQGTLGSYTANNENRVGLYTVSGGTLTLVASCANDGNLWQTVASNTFGAKAFSSTYAASPGLYYIGLLYSNSAVTTAPTIGISSNVVNSNVQSGDFSNGLGLQLVKTTVVALPSSITASTYTQVQQQYWAAIY